ncbi:squalene/phytoene synthase family protein [Sphingomonas naphthae]|uniref:Squalene/phytoene synthase family protein n=1 Tax=Sphingomonas naphthae TaxID=1813468 RepID=A0ABY7TKL1_9SPHN|nr:squalene/phytoene synthase family protein [Sphingomonas naphthae]WCT73573.1 squalene/phytoene synthase family protein [Sphingomonas naphthae]
MTDIADPERALVLAYAPAERREALTVLWRLDERLGGIVAATREAMIGRIRLAWWREALEALDTAEPPAEPLLRDIAHDILTLGISGTDLAAIEGGWAALIDEPDIDTYARERGGTLFTLAARILGGSAADVARAGEGWALADLAHRSTEPALCAAARSAAQARLADPPRLPPRLRALGALTTLARRDARAESRQQGAPGRVARILWYRLTGR